MHDARGEGRFEESCHVVGIAIMILCLVCYSSRRPNMTFNNFAFELLRPCRGECNFAR